MMNKITPILFLIFILGTAFKVKAQEFPVQTLPPISNGVENQPLWKPISPTAPEERQPRLQLSTEQDKTSVFMRKKQKKLRQQEQQVNQSAQLWRASIGNTSVNNWSPYPDRALDARTISFPLPRKP